QGSKEVPVTAGKPSWVTIPAQTHFASLQVVPIDDSQPELEETVEVTVIGIEGSYEPVPNQSFGKVAIVDNEPDLPFADSMQGWIGRVDGVAQENYEALPWNRGMIELRRSNAVGMLNVNFSASGTATLNDDYSLWGPVSTGYYTQILDSKLSTSGKVTF